MTKIKRRAFTAEFKLEAVRMVTDKGLGVPEVCASLGLGETALRRWLVQYKADVLGKAGPGLPITHEQRRIRELELELRQAKLDNELLKKPRPSLPASSSELCPSGASATEGLFRQPHLLHAGREPFWLLRPTQPTDTTQGVARAGSCRGGV